MGLLTNLKAMVPRQKRVIIVQVMWTGETDLRQRVKQFTLQSNYFALPGADEAGVGVWCPTACATPPKKHRQA